MRGNRMRGFTLVELMVTLAVAAVLLSVAVPSFRGMMAHNELVTVTNAWVGAIQTARAEAIKRNQAAVLCGEKDAPSSGIGSNCDAALAGQIRYLPRNGGAAEILHAALTDSVSEPLAIPESFTVRFRGDGIGYWKDNVTTPYDTARGDPTVVVLCSTAFSVDNARRIELVAGSSVQVVTETRPTCPK